MSSPDETEHAARIVSMVDYESGRAERGGHDHMMRPAEEILQDVDRLQKAGYDITASAEKGVSSDGAPEAGGRRPASHLWSREAEAAAALDRDGCKNENGDYGRGSFKDVVVGLAQRGVDFREKDESGKTARQALMEDLTQHAIGRANALAAMDETEVVAGEPILEDKLRLIHLDSAMAEAEIESKIYGVINRPLPGETEVRKKNTTPVDRGLDRDD